MSKQPGLPLTTGEGNTDERARSRAEHALTAWGEPYQGDGNLRSFTEALAHDVLALLAECGRLREQLDAARADLKRAASEPTELAWPADVRKFAQAVELLERCVEVVDPDTNLDLLADIQRCLGG